MCVFTKEQPINKMQCGMLVVMPSALVRMLYMDITDVSASKSLIVL